MEVAIAAPPDQIKPGEAGLNAIPMILTRNYPHELLFRSK